MAQLDYTVPAIGSTDWGTALNEILNEIKTDFNSLDTTVSGKVGYEDLTTVHCVVQTYKSGNSWYRVYDDGWVEQGGFASPVGSDGHACTITFLKPFANTGYVFLKANQSANSTTDNLFTGTYSGKTTTSIKVYNFSSWVSGASWFACGWGA